MTEKDLIETRKVLEAYGQQTISLMKNTLSSNGKDATGNLSNSLNYQIDYNGSSYDIEFSMVDYGEFVEKGRRPGKQPPLQSISKWASIKGIQQKYVFPIARHIGKFGIKATPFFDSSIQSGQDQLIKDLEVAYSKDVENWLNNQIKNKF